MVDRTHYTDGAELTCQKKDRLVSLLTYLENYNIYSKTPAHYGQYVPLVHVLNYGNIHGDVMVRFVPDHLLHKFF